MLGEEKNIVFDMDDIMWGLNYRVCDILGIDINRITNFSIGKCTMLTKQEQENIIHMYSNASTFRDIVFFPKVKKIMSLQETGYRVSICSNALSKEIADLKFEQLKSHITGIKDEQININVIDNKQHNKKKLINNIWRFIDDSSYNVALSNATFNYMKKYPWNQSEDGQITVGSKPTMYFDSFEEIYSHLQTDIARDKYHKKLMQNF